MGGAYSRAETTGRGGLSCPGTQALGSSVSVVAACELSG